jgi:RNase adapter protein RapZ
VKRRRPTSEARQLVILTGLSGSGKSTILKAFEDLGFYCVDNLPVDLIPKFSELHRHGNTEIERAALLVDVREGAQIGELPRILRELRRETPATLVFVEASEVALLRRFSETRRPHPLAHDMPVREALKHERELMAPIRKIADIVIDTTKFNVHELRHFVSKSFFSPGQSPLMVSVVSFGYRYGVPADADLVFDVRFLPNPHFIPRLRKYSGLNPRVERYMRAFPETGQFLKRIEGLLKYLIPLYVREGKSYLTIAFGCTGGRHRSVMLAAAVRSALERLGYTAKAVHRDIEK